MIKCVAVITLILCNLCVCNGQDQWKNIYSEDHWKERDQWQKPEAIIKQINLKPGSAVADIGSHEGYMTIKLAKEVGTTGKVFAVDLQQNRLDKLSDHLKERGIQQVTTIKGDFDNPHLSSNSLDGVLIMDTYHEMQKHDEILRYIKLALKPEARLVICEPIAQERRNLTRAEQERKHELGIAYALEDLRKAGFRVIFKQDPFIDREKIKGDKMWIITAERER